MGEEQKASMRVCSDCRADMTDESVASGRCPLCSGIIVTVSDAEPLLGRTLDGRYSIEARLGSGGMGAVYRATQLAVRRPVAIKILPPVYASRPRSIQRFEREARAVSLLNHPSIVTVHDFGRSAEGFLYLVMELLEGQSLADLLRGGPLSLRRAVRLLEQVCAALTEAHGKGVVHCDLKPDNIFVVNRQDQEDAVKVLDFGIAAMVRGDDGSSSGSSSREVSGTPDYMSPERILGKRVGPETDLYSLGIILYQVLTGSRPYAATKPMHVCLRHLNDPIPVLPPVLPADDCPSRATQALLDRLLHKDPLARLSSAEEARSALWALLRDDGDLSDAVAPPAPAEGRVSVPDAEAPGPLTGDQHGQVGDLPTQVRCARCGNFNAGHWRFCGSCGAPMDEQPPCSACGAPLAPGSLYCTVCGLRHAGEREADAPIIGATESRRVVCTVHALASCEPTSALILDLEDRLEFLRPLQEQWAEAVRALGGTVHGESGEGLCAIFGVPATGQTDALTAVRCALSLARAASDMEAGGGRFVFRCGVSTGPALVRRRAAGSWSVKGDVVVQAALLAGDAPAGGVLCCDATWHEVREAAVGSAYPTTDGRGAARWLLRELRSHSPDRPRRPGPGSVPLLGRDTELATLQGRFLATVHRGTPHLVTIVGAPGVGKSRLVNELVDWVQGTLPETLVLRARAFVQAEQAPYQIIRQVAASAAAAVPDPGEQPEFVSTWLDGVGPPEAPRFALPGLEPGGDGDSLLQQRGVAALKHLMHRLTRGRALVIALDDLHAADAASLDLLTTLLDGLTDVPVLVVCCAAPQLYELRPQWDAGGAVRTRLDLRPLAPGPMGRFVDALLVRVAPPSTAVRNLVLQRSEGNPWFAEEVVRLLVQRGVIAPQPDGTWLIQKAHLDNVTMPRSIEGLLQARLDVLGDDERAILSAAAVVGTVFWEGAVEALLAGLGKRALSDGLLSLRRAGLIRKRRTASLPGEREYRFAGGLLREVVHAGLLRKARRAGHQAVARWLEARVSEASGDLAGTLAAHFEEGGELAQAFHWYRVAADRADAVLASAEARRCLARAIALAPHSGGVGGLAALHERLGDVLLHDGDHEEARTSFLSALSLVGDTSPACAGLLCKIGRTWHLAGRLDLASQSLDRALAAAGDDPSVASLAILAEIGWVEWLRGRYAEAERSLEHGVALADALPGDAKGGGRDRALATLFANLGVVVQSQGNRAGAAVRFAQAGERYLAAGLKASAATMEMNVGLVQLAAGRPDLALTHLSRALAAFEVLGYQRGVSGAHTGLGRAYMVSGRPGDAEAHLILGRNIGAECGASVRVADACCGLAEQALRQGQLDRAYMEALRAAEEAARCQDADVGADARRLLGLSLGALGRAEEAHDAFRAAVAALEARGGGGSTEALARTCRAWGGHCLEAAGEGERRVELLRRGAALLRRAAATYQALGLKDEADEAILCLRRTIPLA